jgi:flavin reductase (DIM6/NTAB) family NADH-FMN oxidoreductase RutF
VSALAAARPAEEAHLMGVDPAQFRDAMRRLAGGVTIVTTSDGQRRRGLTATGVCSLSAEPPSLIVCVNRRAEAHDLIAATRRLCVNVLGSAHRSLAECFAGRHGERGEARFLRGQWGTLATGAPCLADAVAVFDCAIVDSWSFATHTVFVCHVVATRGASPDDPLVYFDGSFAALGPHFVDRAMQEAEWL